MTRPGLTRPMSAAPKNKRRNAVKNAAPHRRGTMRNVGAETGFMMGSTFDPTVRLLPTIPMLHADREVVRVALRVERHQGRLELRRDIVGELAVEAAELHQDRGGSRLCQRLAALRAHG